MDTTIKSGKMQLMRVKMHHEKHHKNRAKYDSADVHTFSSAFLVEIAPEISTGAYVRFKLCAKKANAPNFRASKIPNRAPDNCTQLSGALVSLCHNKISLSDINR